MRDDSVPGRAKRRTRHHPARRGAAPLAAALGLAAAPARAVVPGGIVRGDVLTDMSGGTAEGSGQACVAAAKLAGQDAGGKAMGAPAEVIAADRRNTPGNTPDVGAVIARRRLDREGVHAVVDPPFTRIAPAGATITRGRDRAVPGRHRAVPGADGQGAVQVTGHRVCPGAPPAERGVRGRRRLGRGGHEGGGGGAGGVSRPDGDDARVLYDLTLYEVESPKESRSARDDDRPVARTPAAGAFRPLADGGRFMSGKT